MSEEIMNATKTEELLTKIYEQNKKNLFYQRLVTIFLLVVALGVLAVVPSTIDTLHTTKATMESLDGTISKMDTALDSVTELAEEGSAGMQDALEKINSIDIETLNSAINDLNEVVQPMADFFGRFR